MGIALLVVGYPIALAVLARLRLVLVERRVWWFVVLETAMATIVAGWWWQGQPVGVIINGAAFVGFAIAWFVTARRSGHPHGREDRAPAD